MYVLKAQPDDFLVEEIPDYELLENGKYLLLKVVKRGRNTEEVAQELAKQLRVPRQAISYAGTKDRHAVTIQYFSVKGKVEDDAAHLSLLQAEVVPVGYLNQPLALGMLKGNAFRILVRNLSGEEKISLPQSIPNYFDEQRFSTKNVAVGRAIIKKEFKAAVDLLLTEESREQRIIAEFLEKRADYVGALVQLPRQILKLYLHAYQSYLWNETAAAYIMEQGEFRTLAYSQGELAFPKGTVAQVDVPLLGFSTESKKFQPIIDRVLEKERISLHDFIIRQLPNLSLEGATRPLLMDSENFSHGAFSDDELNSGKKKMLFRFTLGKGSYATMLVRSLL